MANQDDLSMILTSFLLTLLGIVMIIIFIFVFRLCALARERREEARIAMEQNWIRDVSIQSVTRIDLDAEFI